MYSKKVIEHFTNPKFAGEMKDYDAVGEVGNVKCGDVMRIYLKINDNVITEIKFLTYGCAAAIAASDAMCELAKDKTIEQALKITAKDIAKELGNLPPQKFHCSVLGTDALKKAIENYKKNKTQ